MKIVFVVSLLLFVFKLSITEATTVYAWGENQYAQLGNGTQGPPVRKLIPISFYNDKNLVEIRTSVGYDFAIMADGTIWGVGNNFYGQIGASWWDDIVKAPLELTAKSPFLKGCDIIPGVLNVNAYCSATQAMWGWGYAAGYVKGDFTNVWRHPWATSPSYGFDGNVIAVNSVEHGVFVTVANGSVYAAGKGDNGRLGVGDLTNHVQFVQLDFWNTVQLKRIANSQNAHVCALAINDTLFCWGSNDEGQLGLGDTTDRSVPTRVAYFDDGEYIVNQLLTSQDHTLALTCGGRVFTWGSNLYGQLGISSPINYTSLMPVEIAFLSDKNVVEIVVGNNQNFARTATNEWYVWGGSYGGILGLLSDADVFGPVLNTMLSELGINHIVSSSAAVSAFGWNKNNVATTRVGCPPMVNECLSTNDCTKVVGGMCIDTDRHYKCACAPGFRGNGIDSTISGLGGDDCTDIDECAENIDQCVPESICINTIGSYICSCPNDTHGDGMNPSSGGQGCIVNVDECANETANPCAPYADCIDDIWGYNCTCQPGFIGDGILRKNGGSGCIDINECTSNNTNITCGNNAQCLNTPGSWACQCLPGYAGNAATSCLDYDECQAGLVCSPCASCTNTIGSYTCICLTGYTGNGTHCVNSQGRCTPQPSTGGIFVSGPNGAAAGTIGGLFDPVPGEYVAEIPATTGPSNIKGGQNVGLLSADDVKIIVGIFVSIVGIMVIVAIVYAVMVYRRYRYE